MSVNDVSGFLTKTLRERDFNFKDPSETIYWFCFKNGYKFPKMLELKQRYEEMEGMHRSAAHHDKTVVVLNTLKEIANDDELLQYLHEFSADSGARSFSLTSWYWFSKLYAQSKEVIADFYNADEIEKREFDPQNQSAIRVWTPEDITDGDVEKILCCGTPVDRSGNLMKMSASRLAKYFGNKRFSRQHISDLLLKTVAVDRFDLITLNFFLFSQDKKYADDNRNRYIAFVDSTNAILEECLMGEMYIANPYECFLLMCILSECPLGTYADVFEMSFEQLD